MRIVARNLACSVRIAALTLLVAGAAACDDGTSPTTTEAVTLTTAADVDPMQLGDEILATAGARDAVVRGDGAEERIVELGANWCTTALRSDVDNADATFRYALNDLFTEWGLVGQGGETQDVPLARAMLVGRFADPLAEAVNESLCPEVDAGDP